MAFIQSLPTNLKNDSDRIKHDSKTQIDKQVRQVGMNVDHTIRPEKVLFFADPYFFVLKNLLTANTFCFSLKPSQLA